MSWVQGVRKELTSSPGRRSDYIDHVITVITLDHLDHVLGRWSYWSRASQKCDPCEPCRRHWSSGCCSLFLLKFWVAEVEGHRPPKIIYDNIPDHFELFRPVSLGPEKCNFISAKSICVFGPVLLENRLFGLHGHLFCAGDSLWDTPLYDIFPSLSLDLAVKM